MIGTFTSFSSLYLATLLMLIGTGLFNTYMALRLTAESVSAVWVGSLMAAYYLGLVLGARGGHKLIIRVGHIRAYVACAALATVLVLAQSLVSALALWLVFRVAAGMAMVTQFMVLESWLNEQSEAKQRGRVFSFYMVVSTLGTVVGQVALSIYPALDNRPLIFVAMCQVICLVPIALTARSHPAAQLPAPLDMRFFLRRVPMALTAVFVAGNILGAFYGLAPVYAVKQGLGTSQAALFVATAVAAGLIAQWPTGWLSDRYNRVKLLRASGIALAALPVILWGWFAPPFWTMLTLAVGLGVLQFTLYPLGAALANDHVESERRVGLTAVMQMVYGLGACLGPLAASLFMDWGGAGAFYVYVSLCAGALIVCMRPERVTNRHQAADAPVHHEVGPDGLQASPMIAALDPRGDPNHDVYVETVVVEGAAMTEHADRVQPDRSVLSRTTVES